MKYRNFYEQLFLQKFKFSSIDGDEPSHAGRMSYFSCNAESKCFKLIISDCLIVLFSVMRNSKVFLCLFRPFYKIEIGYCHRFSNFNVKMFIIFFVIIEKSIIYEFRVSFRIPCTFTSKFFKG